MCVIVLAWIPFVTIFIVSIARSISSGLVETAGSSIWMYVAPACSRALTSSWIAAASARANARRFGYCSSNDQSIIVYGPVSIPLTGLLVNPCAKRYHSTAIGFVQRIGPGAKGLR